MTTFAVEHYKNELLVQANKDARWCFHRQNPFQPCLSPADVRYTQYDNAGTFSVQVEACRAHFEQAYREGRVSASEPITQPEHVALMRLAAHHMAADDAPPPV